MTPVFTLADLVERFLRSWVCRSWVRPWGDASRSIYDELYPDPDGERPRCSYCTLDAAADERCHTCGRTVHERCAVEHTRVYHGSAA
ncbi:MAG TPA: hypothetical protein VM925_32280 [Labilithrix sp.]|nr:hypothetical protein [Labilithrix sp.]